MTTLNELAFHHLQLAVNGASRPRLAAVNAALAELRATELGPGDLLRRLVPHLLHAGEPATRGPRAHRASDRRAGDYQTAIGPALPMIADNAMRRIPIWVSWQMRRRTPACSCRWWRCNVPSSGPGRQRPRLRATSRAR